MEIEAAEGLEIDESSAHIEGSKRLIWKDICTEKGGSSHGSKVEEKNLSYRVNLITFVKQLCKCESSLTYIVLVPFLLHYI